MERRKATRPLDEGVAPRPYVGRFRARPRRIPEHAALRFPWRDILPLSLTGPNDRHQRQEKASEAPLSTVRCMAWFGVISRSEFYHLKRLAPLLGVPEVMLHLMVQPTLRRRAKGNRQPHCHFRTDTRPTNQVGKRVAAPQAIAADARQAPDVRKEARRRLDVRYAKVDALQLQAGRFSLTARSGTPGSRRAAPCRPREP